MKCKNCGFSGKEDFIFCPRCGTKAEATMKKVAQPKTRTVKKETAKKAANKPDNKWLLILLGVAAVVVLGYFILSQGSRNDLLLVLPRSATKSDLMLIRAGDELEKGVRLLKNYTTALKSGISNFDKFPLGSTVITSAASFSADGKSVFATYQDENDQYLDKIDVQSKTEQVLYQSGYTLNAWIQPKAEDVLIREARSTTSCELLGSRKGEEAKSLLKGKTCAFSADGSTMMLTQDAGTTAVTLSVARVAAPEKEVSILKNEPNVLSFNISGDGSLLYVSKGALNGTKRIALYDTFSGDQLVESQPFNFQYASRFSSKGHGLFFITEDEKGLLSLFIFDGSQFVPVKTGKSFHPAFNLDGTLMAYAVSQDMLSQTAFLYDIRTKTEVEVTSGKSLSFNFVENPGRLLVRDSALNEPTIYSTDLKGASGVELFDKSGYLLSSIFQPIGQNRLFILATKATNMHLYTTSLDKADGFFLIEDFKTITPHTASSDGKWLIFSGTETVASMTNATRPLYRIEVVKDGALDKLENDGTSYTNAVFTPGDKTLLYTMKTGTDRTDSVVKSIEMKDGAKPVELYDQAIIQDVRWGRLYPWQLVAWSIQTVNGMTVCTDAKDLAAAIGRVESNLTAGQNDCFKLSLTLNEPISFTATNSFGAAITMNVIDRSGINFATSRATQAVGTNESISSLVYFPAKTGVFYLKVSSLKSAPYIMDVAVRKNSFNNARTIQPDQVVEGSLGKADYFIDRNYILQNIQGYGQAFSFSGNANQKVTVTLTGKVADPNLKPTFALYNFSKRSLVSGIFSKEKDGELSYTLPLTGRYFFLFLSANPRYGIGLVNPYDYSLLVKLS